MKDWFDGDGKQECRRRNLEVARSVRELWESDGSKLRCKWCELSGDSVGLSLKNLNGILQDRGFVGVDTSREKIRKMEGEFPEHTWICGDIYSKISELQRLKVGVLNLDGYGNAGREGASLQAAMAIVTVGMREFGAFLLILNRSLDGNRRLGISPSTALREQAKKVAEVASGCGLTLNQYDILGHGDEKAFDDPKFVGEIGAFHVYKSKRQRMANLRVIF